MIRAVGVVITMCIVVVLAAGCKGSVDPQRAIAKAQEYREKGDKKAAIIEAKNILQSNPSHAEARYVLGATYFAERWI
jgi:cellulose synthase operon protein C